MSGLGLKLLVCIAAFVYGDSEPNQINQQVVCEVNEFSRTEQLEQQIRSTQFAAMEPNSMTQSNTLKDLIDQIQTLRLPSEMVKPEPKPAEPNKTEVASADKKIAPEPAAQTDTVVQDTSPLVAIDAVANPLNPLASADALYRMGDYSRAIRFYEKIIEEKSDPNVVSRQWAIYQAANCVRYQDRDKAVALYARLLFEYPNNPWAEAAMVQKRSLEWLKKNDEELKRRIEPDAAKR
jgi:tetratricopeptide (TPR) repeat protein